MGPKDRRCQGKEGLPYLRDNSAPREEKLSAQKERKSKKNGIERGREGGNSIAAVSIWGN